jgi:Ca-activated chloride channel family protein
MSFDNPRFLLGLVLIIPIFLFSIFHYRKRRAILDFLAQSFDPVKHGSTQRASSQPASVQRLRFRYFLSSGAFALFLACMILALAEPRGGTRLVSETRRGVDVIFAVDLSRSMEVRDVSPDGPSRLGQAAATAMEMVSNPWFTGRSSVSPGVRFGAAIGKGTGVLALPLTEDTEAILTFLSGLSGAVLTGTGTNLESLIDAASGAFQDAFPSRRRIILLSDGESLGGSLSAALERAADAEIAIITVGFGSPAGGAVSLGTGTLVGEDGYPVISRLQEETLRDAAERTGGVYVNGNRSNAAALLADHLASLASPGSLSGNTTVAVKGFRQETRPLGYLFIIAALAFLGLAKLAEKGRRHG